MDFQEGNRVGHLGFTVGTILAVFSLQVAPIFPIKFRVKLPYVSGVEVQSRFSRCWRGGHFEFPIVTILATFDLRLAMVDFRSERFWLCLINQSSRYFLFSLELNWPFH